MGCGSYSILFSKLWVMFVLAKSVRYDYYMAFWK